MRPHARPQARKNRRRRRYNTLRIFFRTENDADDCGSFAAVERSLSDRLLGSFIHDGPSQIEEVAREKREERDV